MRPHTLGKSSIVAKCLNREDSGFHLNVYELALFTSCLISVDILISSNVTRFKHFPTIFTIILGAGLWNDVVVVVLTQAFSDELCPYKGLIDAYGNCSNDPDAKWTAESLYYIPA